MEKKQLAPQSKYKLNNTLMRSQRCIRLLAACMLVAASARANPIDFLQTRVEQGDPKSETDLGDDYELGTDVAIDKEKGFKLLKIAAGEGYPRAENDLAILYLKGEGVPANTRESLIWLHKASDQGYVYARAIIGAIYETGAYGLKKDDREARIWYEMAARGGHEESCQHMADYCAKGIGGSKDMQKALAWALRSAEAGMAKSCGLVACYYYNGDGLEKNYVLAWIWSELALKATKEDGDFMATMKQVNDYSWSQLGDAERADASRKANVFGAGLQKGEPSLIPWVKNEMQVSYDLLQDQKPFQFSEGAIWLPVMIGQEGPFWFMLDTGSCFSTIDETLAKHLALTVQGSYPGLGNDLNPRYIVETDYSVFGNKVQNGSFVSIPFTPISRLVKRQVSGVLGMDFIDHFVVTLNYRKQSIGLFNPDKYHYTGHGTVLPIVMSGGCPTITTRINDKNGDPVEIQFRIDTGDTGAVDLSTILAKDREIIPLFAKQTHHIADIYGNLTSCTDGVLPLLEMGPLKIPQTTMTLSDSIWAVAPTIGNTIWQKFILTFDYSRKQIILEGNK